MRRAILLTLIPIQVFALRFDHKESNLLKENKQLSTKSITFDRSMSKNLEADRKSFNKVFSLAPYSAKEAPRNGSLRVDQFHRGLRVYGAQVVYHFENGKLDFISGRTAAIEKSFSLSANLTYLDALKLLQADNNNATYENAELVIFPTLNKNILAWHFNENAMNTQRQIFIDAQTGKRIFEFNNLKTIKHTQKVTAPKVSTYTMVDFQDSPWAYYNLPGDLMSESEISASEAAVDADKYSKAFLELMKDKFNRDSYDNQGTDLISSVHYGKDYVNAFWTGRQMVYGDGDGVMSSHLSKALDVIAHEFSHGITSSSSRLIYNGESGALNEAFSDIMGTYAESIIQEDDFDWLLGEDTWTPNVANDALRYMDNPIKDKEGVNETRLEELYQECVTNQMPECDRFQEYKKMYSRDYYSDRYVGELDNSGVHLNSGIANLAFYLLVNGGKHPRAEVRQRTNNLEAKKIGMEKAIKIFYEAFTEYLVPSSTFKDALNATVKVAKKRYNNSTAKAVKKAWKVVGVK